MQVEGAGKLFTNKILSKKPLHFLRKIFDKVGNFTSQFISRLFASLKSKQSNEHVDGFSIQKVLLNLRSPFFQKHKQLETSIMQKQSGKNFAMKEGILNCNLYRFITTDGAMINLFFDPLFYLCLHLAKWLYRFSLWVKIFFAILSNIFFWTRRSLMLKDFAELRKTCKLCIQSWQYLSKKLLRFLRRWAILNYNLYKFIILKRLKSFDICGIIASNLLKKSGKDFTAEVENFKLQSL